MVKHVKLSLSNRNVESLLVLAENVNTKMSGNVRFPSPPVTMVALAAATELLDEAHQAAVLTRSILAFADERARVIVVEDMLRQLGEYVEMIANGSEVVILDAGMSASKNRERQPAPEQVTGITAKFTGIPGSILLAWKRPLYTKMFKVYMSTDPSSEDEWQLVDTITTRKLMVTSLESGERFYFKVVPVGTAGDGPDSAIVQSVAA